MFLRSFWRRQVWSGAVLFQGNQSLNPQVLNTSSSCLWRKNIYISCFLFVYSLCAASGFLLLNLCLLFQGWEPSSLIALNSRVALLLFGARWCGFAVCYHQLLSALETVPAMLGNNTLLPPLFSVLVRWSEETSSAVRFFCARDSEHSNALDRSFVTISFCFETKKNFLSLPVNLVETTRRQSQFRHLVIEGRRGATSTFHCTCLVPRFSDERETPSSTVCREDCTAYCCCALVQMTRASLLILIERWPASLFVSNSSAQRKNCRCIRLATGIVPLRADGRTRVMSVEYGEKNGNDGGYRVRDGETARFTPCSSRAGGGTNRAADAVESGRSTGNAAGRAFQSAKTCSGSQSSVPSISRNARRCTALSGR